MDELEKLRKEIEKLKGEIHCGGYKSAQEHSCDACIVDIYQNILSLIYSMQKEHASEDLEKASYYFACKCHPLKTEYGTSSPNPEVIEAFKGGAEWQKQQMMKDAVEAEVMIEHRRDGIHCKLIAKSHLVEYAKLNCSDGDKVRVIIIKED